MTIINRTYRRKAFRSVLRMAIGILLIAILMPAGSVNAQSDYFDDFSNYPTGEPPSGWLLRGATEVTPTIEEVGGNRLVNFPEIPWQYWDKWLLKDGFIPSSNYTVTVKLNFQNNIADRAGLTIAWNDSNGHIDIQPNVYGDDIEFRPMPSPNLVITNYNSIVINGYTDYWLRVIVTDQGPNQGIAEVYWSTDNISYIHVLTATGLARVSGLVGMSTAGPHLPHTHFDDFSVTSNTPTPTPESTFNISGFKINNAGSGMQGWNITLTNSTMQISNLTGADGSYLFTNLTNGTYTVTEEMQTGWTNITSISQQITISGADIMNINFTNAPTPVPPPPSPSITVNGGEDWQAGSSQDIKWSYMGNLGANIKIELLKSGKVNQTIKSKYSIGKAGIGTFNWKIPPNQLPGTDYRIRITSTTNSAYTDSSDGDFSISVPLDDRKCSNAKFIIPNDGNLGWPYMDDGQDVIYTDGTIHRGLDIFPKDPNNPKDYTVYAPYDGKVVSSPSNFRIRHQIPWGFQGPIGVSLAVDTYYGYVTGKFPVGTDVKQGEEIGTINRAHQDPREDHVHFAITYSPPHDTNELIFANSLDPSPFFNAQLNFFDGTHSAGVYPNRPVYDKAVKNWCNDAPVGIIRGVIKTPDGKVVSDAKVEIEGTTQYRWTDYWMNINQGSYIFSNAPVGKVNITASKLGVGSGSVVVTVKASKTIQAPDIILQ